MHGWVLAPACEDAVETCNPIADIRRKCQNFAVNEAGKQGARRPCETKYPLGITQAKNFHAVFMERCDKLRDLRAALTLILIL